MVKHIILWTFKDMPDTEKAKVKKDIKVSLEALKGKIPGLLEITVNVDGRLDSSTADLMLDTTFDNADSLKNYAKHPDHVAAADTYVRPFTAVRSCLDYEC